MYITRYIGNQDADELSVVSDTVALSLDASLWRHGASPGFQRGDVRPGRQERRTDACKVATALSSWCLILVTVFFVQCLTLGVPGPWGIPVDGTGNPVYWLRTQFSESESELSNPPSYLITGEAVAHEVIRRGVTCVWSDLHF